MTEGILFNEEAEQAVLKCLLYYGDSAYPEVSPLLEPGDFYVYKNRVMFETICRIVDRGERPDYITVLGELRRRDLLKSVGGEGYLAELARNGGESLSATQYVRLVRDAATRRQLSAVADQVKAAANDASVDLDEALAMSENAILSARRTGGKEVTTEQLMKQLRDRVTEWKNNPLKEGETRGLATGIGPLDRALGGLEAGLYIVAGRPSMGKTVLVSQCATNIAQRGERVMFFTLELSVEQIGMRLACSRARVELDRLKRGKVTDEEHERVLKWFDAMAKWPLSIHKGVFRAEDIRAIVQREQLRGEVAAVIVDGLWLMPASKDLQNRNLELGNISRGLKLAADDLRVPILAVHQLSRAVELRQDKRPLMSDLRESGRLEEDADVLLMLYREGYYEPDSPKANVAQVWIRKNRLGGPADRCVNLFWQGKYMRFAELEHGKNSAE